jgi:LytS/YehU family sensor histidine kinase
MNPHFIFNSLNAVNAFLWKGNKLEANEYLARFALLMRETLNRSTQTLSRLEDTIHSLENYLGTEQMRLGDRMSYKFEVDDTLDTFSVYFPTMMLQPFVETAIWHGISGLEGEGLITIRFRPDRGRGVLVAEVEDNGRGRQQAAKRNTGHASKSLSITQRRLDLLNMALNTASKTSDAPARRRPEKDEDDPAIEVSFHPVAEMKIIDLLQTDGSAGGTLVRLTLPLKYPKTYARDNS